MLAYFMLFFIPCVGLLVLWVGWWGKRAPAVRLWDLAESQAFANWQRPDFACNATAPLAGNTLRPVCLVRL